jgi:GGDEF domain-containing protein
MSDVSEKPRTLTLPHPYFVWLGQHTAEPWHPWFDNFHSADEVIAAGKTPELIVIATQAEEQDALLINLRRADLTSHCLILTRHESALSPFLANGLWQNEYKEQYQAYQLRKQQLKLAYHDDTGHKLLAYLWLHDETLQPHAVPAKPWLYQYPLLKAWGIKPEDSFSWLSGLKQQSWLDAGKLENRVRFCPCCHSGHLNYIDVCPQCHSIDTEAQSSLHCFSCGHVGAQASFRKLSTLSCPNCLQQLRHIGVDYDRPIENQHCNSCDTLFTDALVQAECLHCHSNSSLNDLQVRNVYSYKLAANGRSLLRQGRNHSVFSLTPGEQMPMAQFYWLIDWQNKLARRHKQTHCILSVQLLNLERFLAAAGEAKGFAQLDALQDRLRNMIRITDACSNYSRDGLLMLLPLTGLAQIKHVYSKLLDIQQKQETPALELSVKAITLPADTGDNIADWLTDELVKATPLL